MSDTLQLPPGLTLHLLSQEGWGRPRDVRARAESMNVTGSRPMAAGMAAADTLTGDPAGLSLTRPLALMHEDA